MSFAYIPIQYAPVPTMPFFSQFPVNTSAFPALPAPESVQNQIVNVSRPSSVSKNLPFSVNTVFLNTETSRPVSTSSSSDGTTSPGSTSSETPAPQMSQMVLPPNPFVSAPMPAQSFPASAFRTKIPTMRRSLQARMEACYNKNMDSLVILETSFYQSIYPNDAEIMRLSLVLQRSTRFIQHWFSCRRLKLSKITNVATSESPKHIIHNVQQTSGSSIFSIGHGADSFGRVWFLKYKMLLRIA